MKTIIFENVDDSTTDLLKKLAEKMGLHFKIKKELKVEEEPGIVTNPELLQAIEDYESGRIRPVSVDFKALKKGFKVVFMPAAIEHLNWWIKEYPKMIAKIIGLANNAAKSPFTGLGKPEPPKGNFKGYWSRRITHEHRMVYKVLEEEIIIMSVKGHY